MLDKIRLNSAGKLPAEYVANLGDGHPKFLDGRCCRFLCVPFGELVERTLLGGSDDEILDWALKKGGPRSDEDCLIWNGYMTRLGWRDESSVRLQRRVREFGLEGQSIETFFDLFDADEGRTPGAGLP